MTFSVDPRLAHASTVPSCYYIDPVVLEQEQVRIFACTWQLVGHGQQVSEPGQFFTASIAGEPILIVRGSDGEFRCLSNVCRHRAGPVASGAGKRAALQCGYHGWTYALDGRLLTTPEMEGVACFERSEQSLPQFRIESWNGLLFVNLDDGAPALRDFLGVLATDAASEEWAGYRLAARKDWRLDCNWKVYVDNYLEGYHIPIVHPSLFRAIDYANYRTETREHYSIQHAPIRRQDRMRAASNSSDNEVKYYWIYPNLMLNVYDDNFSTNLILPLGSGRTLTIFEWYFRNPEDEREAIERTVAFSDEIQIEDIAICEAVQRGLRSRTYDRGRYSPQRENGVHHFHSLYAEAMGRVGLSRS